MHWQLLRLLTAVEIVWQLDQEHQVNAALTSCANDNDCGQFEQCNSGNCECQPGYVDNDGSGCFLNGWGTDDTVSVGTSTTRRSRSSTRSTQSPVTSSARPETPRTTRRQGREKWGATWSPHPETDDGGSNNLTPDAETAEPSTTEASASTSRPQTTRKSTTHRPSLPASTSPKTTPSPPPEEPENQENGGFGDSGSSGQAQSQTATSGGGGKNLMSLKDNRYNVKSACPNLEMNDFCDNNGTCFSSDQPNRNWCLCRENYGGINCVDQFSPSGAPTMSILDVQTQSDKRYSFNGIYGRYQVDSQDQCLQLCQLAKPRCRSFNFGNVQGTNICELLTIAIGDPGNPTLNSFVVDAPGWQYACCIR